MSSAATAEPADELVLVAGEYVLGTLPADEAAWLAREAETDPAVAGAIADWERRLAPLMLQVPATTPPAGLWPRIEATLAVPGELMPSGGGRSAGPTRAVPLAAAVRYWRRAAAVGFLLAASVAAASIIEQPQVSVPVAVLVPVGAKSAAFVLVARRDGSMRVVPMAPALVPSGHDLELWSLAHGSTVPRPLGVLPADGRRLAAGDMPAGRAQFLVSLEPKGGSPTGLPTGPVLYAGSFPRPE